MDKEPKKYLNTIEEDKESIEWLLISENESPRQKKRKGRNSSFSVIHFPLPPLIKLSSHLVRSSRIQFQIKPRFHQGSPLFRWFLSFHPCHVSNRSAFYPPSPSRGSPSLSFSGSQSHPASGGQRARKFWPSSDLSFGHVYPRRYTSTIVLTLFNLRSMLLPEPSVFFLSRPRLSTVPYRCYLLYHHFDRTPSLLFSRRLSLSCFSPHLSLFSLRLVILQLLFFYRFF